MRKALNYFGTIGITNSGMSNWFINIMAILIGVVGGLVSMSFHFLVKLVQEQSCGFGSTVLNILPAPWWRVIVPGLAGIIVGLLLFCFAEDEKGIGIPEVIEAVALKGGRIDLRSVLLTWVATIISIGGGASVGKIGPIVTIGAGISSAFGNWIKLNQDKIRTCVACGAAAGISATFNAPIAGVIFAQEVILGDFASKVFISIVISSVTAAMVSQAALGDAPAFVVKSYPLNNPFELLFFILLGIIAGLIAVLFVRVLYRTGDAINKIRRVPVWLKPAAGGILIGFIALYFPQVLGTGFDTIEKVLDGNILLETLIFLIFVKIIATSLSLGSGFLGGVFAPSLFIGATFGGAFGFILEKLIPGIVGNPGAYAVVGMGAVMAGASQAPITAILLIFEMTRDYRVIAQLMVAVVFSTMIFSYLNYGSIYTMRLLSKGLNIKSGRDLNVMRQIKVQEIMTSPVEVAFEEDKVGSVIKKMHESKHNGFPVLNDKEELVGIITLEDIREAPVEGIMDVPVTKLMSRSLVVVFPGETMDEVFRKLGANEIGHLPVVAAANPQQLKGIITRSDIIKAYEKRLLFFQT